MLQGSSSYCPVPTYLPDFQSPYRTLMDLVQMYLKLSLPVAMKLEFSKAATLPWIYHSFQHIISPDILTSNLLTSSLTADTSWGFISHHFHRCPPEAEVPFPQVGVSSLVSWAREICWTVTKVYYSSRPLTVLHWSWAGPTSSLAAANLQRGVCKLNAHDEFLVLFWDF